MTSDRSIPIVVNGKPQSIAAGLSVDQLLKSLDLPVRGIAVEINGELVPFEEHLRRLLQADDEVEIVTLAGGG